MKLARIAMRNKSLGFRQHELHQPPPAFYAYNTSAEFRGSWQVPLGVSNAWGYTLHEPRGVCGAILPCSESALQGMRHPAMPGGNSGTAMQSRT